MAYPLGHHPSLALPWKSLAVSVSLLIQENCEIREDRVQTRHRLPFWKKHKEGAQYLLAECLFLSAAAASGALGRLRGAGTRDGSPFSPSSFLPIVAMDSESDVGEARQESDFQNLGAFYSTTPIVIMKLSPVLSPTQRSKPLSPPLRQHPCLMMTNQGHGLLSAQEHLPRPGL